MGKILNKLISNAKGIDVETYNEFISAVRDDINKLTIKDFEKLLNEDFQELCTKEKGDAIDGIAFFVYKEVRLPTHWLVDYTFFL